MLVIGGIKLPQPDWCSASGQWPDVWATWSWCECRSTYVWR